MSTIGKKVLNINVSSIRSPNMVYFDPLTADTGSGGWGTQQISTSFACWLRYCSNVEVNQTLHDVCPFPGLVHWYTIYTFLGLLLPQGILPGTKFTLRPNLAFSYIGSVIVRHSSRERQSNFEAFSGGRHLYSAERTSRLALAHILVMVALCNMTLISVISLNVSLSRIFGLHLLILWLSSM